MIKELFSTIEVLNKQDHFTKNNSMKVNKRQITESNEESIGISDFRSDLLRDFNLLLNIDHDLKWLRNTL